MAKYTKEMHDYIASICNGRFSSEVKEMVNDKFGTDFSIGSIKSYISQHKLRTIYKPQSKTSMITDEQVQFLIDNSKGRYVSELTKLFNDKFGTNYTEGQIRFQKQKRHITSGIDAKFKKGQESFNKGKKQTEYMSEESIERTKATRFKKGNTPYNIAAVGTIVTNQGYKYIKVGMPNIWQPYSRYVWEQHYGRKLLDSEKVIFLDNDKNNFNIDNLEAISFNEEVRMNYRGYRTSDIELTKTGLQIVRLGMKIKEKEGK